jgi:prevent-host-death family protein
MTTERIGIRELKERTSEIMRRVREDGQSYEVTYHGRTIALILPSKEPPSAEELGAFWKEWDEVAEAISAGWPEGVSAVDAVREQRRDL